jgi:hypothetical protein
VEVAMNADVEKCGSFLQGKVTNDHLKVEFQQN